MRNTSILESLTPEQLENPFISVSDRYYDHKYCLNINSELKDIHQRISFHTNRICLISLAEHHPIIKNNKRIVKIDCCVDGDTDRLKNAASGKGKRGAQKLTPESILCKLICEDGETYLVYSCIKGKLVEINENLMENPNLLVEKPFSEGFIALLLPVLKEYDELKASMLTKDEYLANK